MKNLIYLLLVTLFSSGYTEGQNIYLKSDLFSLTSHDDKLSVKMALRGFKTPSIVKSKFDITGKLYFVTTIGRDGKDVRTLFSIKQFNENLAIIKNDQSQVQSVILKKRFTLNKNNKNWILSLENGELPLIINLSNEKATELIESIMFFKERSHEIEKQWLKIQDIWEIKRKAKGQN